MPSCSLNCCFNNNLYYGNKLNLYVSDTDCEKCEDIVYNGCFQICHRCCNIESIEFTYQHQNCVGPSTYELNFINVIGELKACKISRREDGNSINWKVEITPKKIISGVNCSECGKYIYMKKKEKYPISIHCY